ncbi:molybdopterin adenylyltransferase [Aquimarina sp. MMG016]|uniref:molybdopterin adenylyltransferase n=1 Tax=Aquimarina sp. MMG016 TaxID=2822690 RepID=UPI001B39D9CB|nr:molybdopterin adenylyltransferase [Aquimarina sp. MMG016]MBQ4821852.1 molybdopterin adenylyltransferase [Aquimarina sp. MMG016]
MNLIKIGILTVSDRASKGIYKDVSGKEIINVLNEYISSEWNAVYEIIPDEQNIIEQKLIMLSDKESCCLIFTTGGTGPAPRDVTPEATERVCHKILQGFGELMRQESLNYVPTAILSRQTAGIRNKTLIVNLPGKPKSIRECIQAVFPAIPYCLELIGEYILNTNEKNIKVFRPK